ncbi:MAG: VOC family protein, partial [Acidimicrobiia bacterium]
MITHIETVAVYASDQHRATSFFVDQLGFELRKDTPMGPTEGDPRWIEVAPPGAQTVLVLVTPPGLEDQIGAMSGLCSSATTSTPPLPNCRAGESASPKGPPIQAGGVGMWAFLVAITSVGLVPLTTTMVRLAYRRAEWRAYITSSAASAAFGALCIGRCN